MIKKVVKKVLRPFVKPLTIRLNNLQSEIENNQININEVKAQIDVVSNLNNQLKIDNDTLHKKLEILEHDLNIYKNSMVNDVENIFYYHGGSGNHGCEALVRTLCKINEFDYSKTILYSYRPQEDYEFGINNIVKNIIPSNLDCNEISEHYKKNSIALSIGGDNYCGYPFVTSKLAQYNESFNKRGVLTALIGCSIEPDVLDHHEVLDDLEQFSLITARETITYESLLAHGIKKNTKLIPDSAFALETIELPLPNNFIEGKTVGINLSNMVQSYDSKAYDNYFNLIKYIIDKTNYNVALIPHVVQDFNDDLELIDKLYREFCDTNRICLIPNSNCMELKGYIKRCLMFVGARTHSTIAAYSSCVPTLVLGYSVKSKGIAKDLFGTYDNYVISVHNLKTDDELVNGFIWLDKNKKNIKKHLEEIMPDYINRCYEIKNAINELREKNYTSQKKLASHNKCSGCGACKNICPQKCIKMEQDNQGFNYPVIDYKKCIHCNLCKSVCPVIKENISSKPLFTYGAYAKDEKIRSTSSSGGIFSLLAKKIVDSGGICVGATTNGHNIEHIAIENVDGIEKLKRSKYAQSDIKDIYIKIKKFLEKGRKVLFTGTPCQVAGLKSFLHNNYSNLICIDIVCHGVPSPLIYSNYLKSLEKDNKCKITNINFRSKENGWSSFDFVINSDSKTIVSENVYENIYMKAFLQNLILRPSCYECSFKNFKSQSDITLGDFWGVEILHKEEKKFLDNKGVSLVAINTKKGNDLFIEISNEIYFKKTNIEEAIKYNSAMTSSVSKSDNYEEFWKNINFDNIKESLDKYTK